MSRTNSPREVRSSIQECRAALHLPPFDASAAEVRDWALRLWQRMDRDGSGSLTRKELECDEFMNIIKETLASREIGSVVNGVSSSSSHSRFNVRDALELTLRKADTNFDGKFQFDEFCSMLSALRGPSSNAHLIYALFDLDGNQDLDKEEFREMYRFIAGLTPTNEEFQAEWSRFMLLGGTARVTLPTFIRWLQTSEKPRFRTHAPPLQLTPTQSQRGNSEAGPRRLPVEKARWAKTFTSGLNPGHINECRPMNRREYFSRGESLPELKHFYESYDGFHKHLEGLDNPHGSPRPHVALIPKVLSSEGGTPLTLPHRHCRGGKMRDHDTRQVTQWTDFWQTPLRFRSHGGDRTAWYRPIAERSTFSDPTRQPLPAKARVGQAALKASRAPKARRDDVVRAARATVLEAEPW